MLQGEKRNCISHIHSLSSSCICAILTNFDEFVGNTGGLFCWIFWLVVVLAALHVCFFVRTSPLPLLFHPCQVTGALRSGVASAIAWVLADPDARGRRFMNLNYRMLIYNADQGSVEDMLNCLRALERSRPRRVSELMGCVCAMCWGRYGAYMLAV